MKKIYTVIRAEMEHVPALVPLFEAYRVFYGQTSDPEQAEAFLNNRLARKESVIFAAVSGEAEGERRLAGFVQLYPSFSSVTMQRLWILNDLFVGPEDRGGGAGALLMEAARRFAEETGSKGLTLTTGTDNRTAQALYERCGYVRDDEFYTYNRFFPA